MLFILEKEKMEREFTVKYEQFQSEHAKMLIDESTNTKTDQQRLLTEMAILASELNAEKQKSSDILKANNILQEQHFVSLAKIEALNVDCQTKENELLLLKNAGMKLSADAKKTSLEYENLKVTHISLRQEMSELQRKQQTLVSHDIVVGYEQQIEEAVAKNLSLLNNLQEVTEKLLLTEEEQTKLKNNFETTLAECRQQLLSEYQLREECEKQWQIKMMEKQTQNEDQRRLIENSELLINQLGQEIKEQKNASENLSQEYHSMVMKLNDEISEEKRMKCDVVNELQALKSNEAKFTEVNNRKEVECQSMIQELKRRYKQKLIDLQTDHLSQMTVGNKNLEEKDKLVFELQESVNAIKTQLIQCQIDLKESSKLLDICECEKRAVCEKLALLIESYEELKVKETRSAEDSLRMCTKIEKELADCSAELQILREVIKTNEVEINNLRNLVSEEQEKAKREALKYEDAVRSLKDQLEKRLGNNSSSYESENAVRSECGRSETVSDVEQAVIQDKIIALQSENKLLQESIVAIQADLQYYKQMYDDAVVKSQKAVCSESVATSLNSAIKSNNLIGDELLAKTVLEEELARMKLEYEEKFEDMENAHAMMLKQVIREHTVIAADKEKEFQRAFSEVLGNAIFFSLKH